MFTLEEDVNFFLVLPEELDPGRIQGASIYAQFRDYTSHYILGVVHEGRWGKFISQLRELLGDQYRHESQLFLYRDRRFKEVLVPQVDDWVRDQIACARAPMTTLSLSSENTWVNAFVLLMTETHRSGFKWEDMVGKALAVLEASPQYSGVVANVGEESVEAHEAAVAVSRAEYQRRMTLEKAVLEYSRWLLNPPRGVEAAGAVGGAKEGGL